MAGERLIWSGSAGVERTPPTLTTNNPGLEGHVMAEQQSTVEYRDIPDFPGYRVSDDGSVWSCWKAYRLTGSIGGCGQRMSDQWHLIKQTPDKRGRPRVGLYRGGQHFSWRVCRLVLEAFVGPCPSGMEACHFPDRNPTNNNLPNLRWDTRQANAFDRIKHGINCGANHPNSKLNDGTAGQIKALLRRGESRIKIAATFGVTTAVISCIARGLTWKHVPTPEEFQP